MCMHCNYYVLTLSHLRHIQGSVDLNNIVPVTIALVGGGQSKVTNLRLHGGEYSATATYI